MVQITAAITGLNFRGQAARQALQRAATGSAVRLVREASNAYDANAVQVHVLGAFVGFVPKSLNAALAAAMDKGAEPVATITRALEVDNRSRVRRDALITVTW